MGSAIVPTINVPPLARESNSPGCKSRNRFTGILTKGLVNPCAVDCLSHFSRYSANVGIAKSFHRATANHGNKRGANLTRPASRHREAPFREARQAAPDGARARWFSEGLENSRFSMQPVAEATQNDS